MKRFDFNNKTTIEQFNILYLIFKQKVDVFLFYGSAALRAGNDFRVALIGMGVAASHGTERTHIKGIEACIDLCMGYLGK